MIKRLCISIALHDLKIGMSDSLFLCFAQNRAADGAGVMLVSAAGIDVDGLEPDVSPIQDAKTRSDHPPINFDAGDDGFFWNGLEHGRDDTAKCRIGRTV